MTEPQVYFVATPIGNLSEMTYRAVETLKNVDIIYCEDTRHTLTLVKFYEITKPLVAYHKFNEKNATKAALNDISLGKKIAVVSDAGMPCISDPGNVLVRELIENNIPYTVISGASAQLNAFVLSGFSAPFTFVGFLPEKNIDRKRLIESLSTKHTLIFYSAVHDVNEDLNYLFTALGSRKVCVARELTKMFETTYFGVLGELVIEQTKGEFVVVVEGDKSTGFESLSPEQHLQMYLDRGMDKMDAVKQVAKERGVPKNEIYQLTLK